MSDTSNTTSREQIVNRAVKNIVNFYKDPLILALFELRKNGYSLNKISETVFNGEISKQAINQNYFKKGGTSK